jgi:hypothetical protein
MLVEYGLLLQVTDREQPRERIMESLPARFAEVYEDGDALLAGPFYRDAMPVASEQIAGTTGRVIPWPFP